MAKRICVATQVKKNGDSCSSSSEAVTTVHARSLELGFYSWPTVAGQAARLPELCTQTFPLRSVLASGMWRAVPLR